VIASPYVLIVSLVFALASGCGDGLNPDPGDGAEDSFLAHNPNVTDFEIRAILELANTANEDMLHSEIGLTGIDSLDRAAANIVAYRNGSDGEYGSDDDQAFDSLSDLDDVPYVGPLAFDHILVYTREEKLDAKYDWFQPESCAGANLVPSDVETLLDSKKEVLLIQEATFRVRSRACDGDGCGRWEGAQCGNGPDGICELDGMVSPIRMVRLQGGDSMVEGLIGGESFGCSLGQDGLTDCWFSSLAPALLGSMQPDALTAECLRMPAEIVSENGDGSVQVQGVLFGDLR